MAFGAACLARRQRIGTGNRIAVCYTRIWSLNTRVKSRCFDAI